MEVVLDWGHARTDGRRNEQSSTRARKDSLSFEKTNANRTPRHRTHRTTVCPSKPVTSHCTDYGNYNGNPYI
jgi:hypothetical protein